ncbi:nitric oxide synthase-interacting protein-like isoform X2 [Hylaeus volcanicus]|uniref:nitric oxide synthase-interacting protein-like isoform X2 n=2 Tax=Hylaeus volcanicus TaxID=313075 RepID=UPI0023B804D8|nr:nitric oxide synthase-interacting protein-like isoform X2 [Hylaeus volcanicus]
MSRHSKNNTAHSFFTYHERKKLKDFGTLTSRLEGESLRRFEDCWLCLSIAVKPVCTLQGYIYCRNCLMENLAVQKEQYERRLHEWHMEQSENERKIHLKQQEESQEEIHKFLFANQGVPNIEKDSFNASSVDFLKSTTDSVAGSKKDISASFWMAGTNSEMPLLKRKEKESAQTKPPRCHFFCPMTKTRLHLKDIVTLHPLCQTQIETAMFEQKQDSWICAITKKQIGFKKAIALKQTGQIILEECLKLNVLQGFIPSHPCVTPSDIVHLIPGGTSFSAHNKVEVKIVRPVME